MCCYVVICISCLFARPNTVVVEACRKRSSTIVNYEYMALAKQKHVLREALLSLFEPQRTINHNRGTSSVFRVCSKLLALIHPTYMHLM